MTSNAAPMALRVHALDRVEIICVQLTRPVAFLGVIGMLAVSGVTMIDVLSRWLFNHSLAATNEVIAMTFAVAVAACIPAGLALRVNLKVDLLEAKLSGRMKLWLTAIGDVLLTLFFLILAWHLAAFGYGLALQKRTTVILQWPQGPFMLAAAILLGVGVVVQAVLTLNSFRRALVCDRSNQPTSPAVRILLILVGAIALALIAIGIVDFQTLSRFARSYPATTVTLACILLWLVLLAYVPLAAVMGLIGICGTA